MGFRVSWIACKDMDVGTLIAKTGCAVGQDQPMVSDGCYAVTTDYGAVLVGMGVDYFSLVTWGMAQTLSYQTDVLYMATNDTVMVSGLSAIVDGTEAWRVVCDASKGTAPAKATGAVPDQVMAVVSQASVDGYQVPAQLGRTLAGLDHTQGSVGTLLIRELGD